MCALQHTHTHPRWPNRADLRNAVSSKIDQEIMATHSARFDFVRLSNSTSSTSSCVTVLCILKDRAQSHVSGVDLGLCFMIENWILGSYPTRQNILP